MQISSRYGRCLPGAMQALPRWRRRRVLTSSSVLVLALTALPAMAQVDGQQGDAVEDASPIDEIVVTGSRIVRSGLTTPVPVQMLGGEAIENAGAITAGGILRELPAVAPGLNSESSGVTFNGAGLDLVDLRSLGTNRTLVLVNGRRQVGSNPNTTSVDLNTIPTQMIERVEVITGGASAVYGADAVSGVLNIILKDDFEGVQLDAQFGIADEGDAERYAVSGLIGTNFADGRGNVTGYLGYTEEEGIAYDAREGGISGLNWIANPENTGPDDGIPDYILLDNIRQLGGQQESAFVLDRGNGLEAFGFNEDGSVREFALGPSGLLGGGQFTDGGEAELGYDAQCPQARCALRIPVERYLLATSADYELTPRAALFFEGRFAGTQSSSRFGSVFEIPPVTNQISIDNPFVSPSLEALLLEADVDSIGILRSDQELGLRGQDTDRRLFQMVGGVRGETGLRDFTYEASVQYGSTRFTNTRVNDLDQARLTNALDAVEIDGEIVCRSEAARAQGCTPVNFLQGGDALTEENLDYVRIPFATETAELEQFVAAANVTGGLGDYWGAGDIRVAAGLEYREEASEYLVSPVDQAGQGFYYTQRQSTSGEYDVFEYFGEVVVPVFTGSRFGEALSVEAAIRRSDYSTSGVTTSWKAGGSYAPVRDIRFRAVRARAVRAPNVGELFSPGSEGFLTVDDPCDVDFIEGGSPGRAANCAALGVPTGFTSNARTINIRTSTSGNPELDVEQADTWTVGAVITPRFIEGLSATVDYFTIQIEDAINVFGAQDILNNCVDLETIDNPFCASITRAPNSDIERIVRQNINVSELNREGIDLELRYNRGLGTYGDLNFSTLLTKMFEVNTIVAPGTLTGSNEIDFNGEYGYPEWKGRFSANWQLEPFEATTTLTYLSSMQRDVQPTNPEDNRATAEAGDFFVLNAQGSYHLTPDIRLNVGIDNLLDEQPPSLPEVRAGGASSTAGAEIYPIVGRYFYGGIRVNF